MTTELSTRSSVRASGLRGLLALALSACGAAPDLPDYEATYTEVRDCRRSGDHQLNYVRVLTDEAATPVYQSRSGSFPEGSVVLKEEYDPADVTCEGPIQRWTRMERRPEDSAAQDLGWRWQVFDAQRRTVATSAQECTGCHASCGVAPDGYEGTCALP